MLASRFRSIPRFALPYTAADFTAALEAVFRGAPPPDAFALLGRSPKFWTRSGRQALRLLLTGLDLKPGSGVAIPLFTDPSLVTAIAAAGHRPVFIDIDPQFLTLDPESLAAARRRFSAVIAVHLFGQSADMDAVQAIAGSAPVIEDAAHAPLSYWKGHLAGTIGVASFYSFASTKYWPAGGGGLAVANDPLLACRLSCMTQLLATPSRVEELRHLAMQAAKTVVFTRPIYGVLGRPLRRWAEKWALLEPCLDLNAIERSYAAAASQQVLRFAPRVERQRENSLRLLSRLATAHDVVLPVERPGAQYNYHLFPVLLRDAEERRAMMASMWGRFVDTSMIYSRVVEECRQYGYEGECPVAESVADRLITLPNYASLSVDEIDYVADVFLDSLRACRTTNSKRMGRQDGIPIPAPRSETVPTLVTDGPVRCSQPEDWQASPDAGS
jgi:dTDP-4-amino-4,6-dideoxygalactose transaminase